MKAKHCLPAAQHAAHEGPAAADARGARERTGAHCPRPAASVVRAAEGGAAVLLPRAGGRAAGPERAATLVLVEAADRPARHLPLAARCAVPGIGAVRRGMAGVPPDPRPQRRRMALTIASRLGHRFAGPEAEAAEGTETELSSRAWVVEVASTPRAAEVGAPRSLEAAQGDTGAARQARRAAARGISALSAAALIIGTAAA